MRPVLLTIAAVTTACVAHYDPPLPAESSSASIPLSVGVVPGGKTYRDDVASKDAISLLDRTGVFRNVHRASSVPSDIVVSVSRYPVGGNDEWCSGDSIPLALFTVGLIPGCACTSGYLMKFSAPGSSDTVEFRFEDEACSWVGWIPLFWNLRPDYHWYGGPDEHLQAEHLAAQLSSVQVELVNLPRTPE